MQKDLLAHIAFTRFNDRTIPGMKAVMKEIENVQAAGHALDLGEEVAEIPDGRFYAGSFNNQSLESADGCLYQVDLDGTIRTVESGLVFPNGMAVSPDGRAFYLTEMWARRIIAFDFDAGQGTFSRRRTLPGKKGLTPEQLVTHPGAGDLFVASPGIRGRQEHAFAG